MPRIKTYKNSKLASFCSVIGYILIAGGVYCLFNDEPLAGVIVLLLGFGFKFLAAFISNRKRKKDAEFFRMINEK